jgi:DNA-binding transcriptional MerR regulator
VKRQKSQPSKGGHEAELAARYGVDARSIRNYRAAGAPIDELEQMDAWVAAQRKAPPMDPSRLNSMADAKLAKLQKEIERLQIRIDSERKRLIPLDDVRANMVRIASAMRAELLRFAGDCPNWEGLKASEMQVRIDSQVRSMCEQLSDQFSELYTA